MPTRILHIVDHLGKGGLENGLVNLISHLDTGRFEHVVYGIRGLGCHAGRLRELNVRLLSLGKQDTDFPIQAAALARIIRELKPDIVHTRNWAAIEGIVAGWWVRSCKLVHSEHGLESDAHRKQPWRRVAFRRLAYELADRVISVSGQLRDLHASRTRFDAGRITVIHNGVDSARYFPDPGARGDMRRALGVSEGEFCIGCVGNLLPVKDHLTILRALEGLDGGPQAYRVVIAGEGPERPNLEAWLQAHPKWRSRVSLIGTSECIPELLNAFDAYVLPSVSEGISNSLLEAMASGVAVIATETGGNPEVVVNGESGLLFPVGDDRGLAQRLNSLRADPELRARIARDAVARVRAEFSIQSMVQQYAQVYESLAAKRGLAAVQLPART